MASSEPNLKVNVGADTSEFTRGIRRARSDIKAFGDVSDNILGKLGSLVGVDTRQVEQMASAIRGMGRKMTEAGAEGGKAFGALAASVSTLGVGIAALGVAGAVAGFKALNAEAEAFKNTVAGANIELQTAAFIDTYRQVFHDFNQETGKSVAEFESKWKKTFAMFGANFSQNLVGLFTGKQGPAASLPDMFFRGNNQQQVAALAGGLEAEAIAKKIYELERKRKEQAVDLAKLNAEIADKMTVARDTSASAADRYQAILQIHGLLNTKRTMTVELEQQLAGLYQKMSNIATDNVAAADALLAQKQRVFDVDRQITLERNSLFRIENGIVTALDKETAEKKKQLELEKQIADARSALKDFLAAGTPAAMTSGATGPVGSIIPQTIDTTALQGQINAVLGGSLLLEVGLQIDKSQVLDFSQQLEATISGLALSLSNSIGGLVGDLVTGGDAWGNFANAAMSAFGDMATSIGRIAIEAGIAALGIKAAITSLGPAGAAIAIGAGTALVALGAAVKAGMSNVAAGNYSSTASVASSNYSTMGTDDFVTRDLTVNVTGTLQADGSQLVAVLDNTNKKKGYTT